jgi:hypothetical protein
MEKQKLKKEINYNFNWSDATIGEIRKNLDKMESLGVTNIEISYHGAWESLEYECYSVREETDKEQESRLRQEKAIAELQKENELRQYNRIKTKYNL